MKIVDVDYQKFKDSPTPVTPQGQGDASLVYHLMNSTIDKEMQTVKNYTRCIDHIAFSSFNPVPPHRKLAGDLFYLTVKTLDAGEKGITASINGFYLNDSSEKGTFNPELSQKNPLQAYSLVALLNQLSPGFSGWL